MLDGTLLAVYAAVLGLLVGSFLNVLIHRVPRQLSFVVARSRCTFCDASIKARDNIPLLSYLLLRGKCRACSAPISLRYPAVEALTALAFVACVLRFGGSAATAVAAIFCALLIALALIDAEHFLLPDILTLPGILLGLALQPLFPAVFFLDALLGTILGAGILILIVNFWFWLRDEEGMGLGDVNMLAMVGAFLGWQGMLVTFVAAAFLGTLTGVTLIAARRMGVKSKLPFGVFLAVGAAVALFWGNEIVDTYRGLL